MKVISNENTVWNSYSVIATNELGRINHNITRLCNNPSGDNLDSTINNLSKILYMTAKTCAIQKESKIFPAPNDIKEMSMADEIFRQYSSEIIDYEQWQVFRRDTDKDSIPFDSKTLVSCEQLDILGGFISDNLELN